MITQPTSHLPARRRISVMAELVPIGDGSMALKTRASESDLDTWVTVQEAAELLNLAVTSIYSLLDSQWPFLVSRRPLPRKITISLASITAFKQATADTAFWSDAGNQAAFVEGVRRKDISAHYNFSVVNGTLVAKPQSATSAKEAEWVTPRQAAEILGMNPRRVYQLINGPYNIPYLVSKRILLRKLVISAESIKAFKRAVADPTFWRDKIRREKFVADVSQAVAALALEHQQTWAAAEQCHRQRESL
jgi:hypothetical protein